MNKMRKNHKLLLVPKLIFYNYPNANEKIKLGFFKNPCIALLDLIDFHSLDIKKGIFYKRHFPKYNFLFFLQKKVSLQVWNIMRVSK